MGDDVAAAVLFLTGLITGVLLDFLIRALLPDPVPAAPRISVVIPHVPTLGGFGLVALSLLLLAAAASDRKKS